MTKPTLAEAIAVLEADIFLRAAYTPPTVEESWAVVKEAAERDIESIIKRIYKDGHADGKAGHYYSGDLLARYAWKQSQAPSPGGEVVND